MKKLLLIIMLFVCASFTACTAPDNGRLTVVSTNNEAEEERAEEIVVEEEPVEEVLQEVEDETGKILGSMDMPGFENEAEEAEEVVIEDGALKPLPGREIVLKSYKITGSGNSKFIEIKLDYTNKALEASAFSAGAFEAYQDGAQLSFNGGEDHTTRLRAGATVEVSLKFRLRNEASDVELEFYDFSGSGAAKYSLKIAE